MASSKWKPKKKAPSAGNLAMLVTPKPQFDEPEVPTSMAECLVRMRAVRSATDAYERHGAYKKQDWADEVMARATSDVAMIMLWVAGERDLRVMHAIPAVASTLYAMQLLVQQNALLAQLEPYKSSDSQELRILYDQSGKQFGSMKEASLHQLDLLGEGLQIMMEGAEPALTLVPEAT